MITINGMRVSDAPKKAELYLSLKQSFASIIVGNVIKCFSKNFNVVVKLIPRKLSQY